ncbi:MAG: hypothetical protein IJC26_05885, partial [Clostridia bacterium]|nr:hypothetical protein [Clostridia bacterium]
GASNSLAAASTPIICLEAGELLTFICASTFALSHISLHGVFPSETLWKAFGILPKACFLYREGRPLPYDIPRIFVGQGKLVEELDFAFYNNLSA